MKIKTSDTKSPLFNYTRGFFTSYLKRHRAQAAALLVCLYSLLIFIAGILAHKSGVIEDVIKPAIKTNRIFLKHWMRGAFIARPDEITIDIKYEDFQKLEYRRREALEANLLMKKDAQDYVPARIRYNARTLKAKVRLKGDHTDHLEGAKWSFRVVMKGGDTLFGMKVFSLQHPRTRNYIYEWLYHQALKREGLVSLRYDFIDVVLNGRKMGIYAIEEFFDKRLIEHNEYREGPIIRFDETEMWEELLQRGEVVNSGTYLSSPIDAFQTNKILSDQDMRQVFTKAISLLEAFRKGELKASDVFDVKKLARFFAITDLMGAEHATIWINMRFYFNPVTARLEPIGFDANCMPIENLCLKQVDNSYGARGTGAGLENLYSALAGDRAFFEDYVKELERVSDPAYLESFFSEIGGELKKKLDILYKELPQYNFSKDMYYHNQHIIDVNLNPVKTVNAYLNKADEKGMEIELGNVQIMDTEILGLGYKDNIFARPLENVILPGKISSEPVTYQKVRFIFPEGFVWQDDKLADIKVVSMIIGTNRERYENIFPFARFVRAYIDNDFVRKPPNAERFDFIIVDKAAKKIFIKQGAWVLSKDLIFPAGFTVVCPEGVSIDLINKARILSFSPLDFIGTVENPIVIYSSDSTGQGILVMADGQRSILNHVTFRNLAAPVEEGWKLTGAVTFYESPVDIYNCGFLANRLSDDGLNIVRSEFTMDRVLFKDVFSDAFDGDFVKGRITNSMFIKCGNDAVDVSGSSVYIKNILVDGNGDKGISAGEVSAVSAEEVEVRNGNIGVAAKDLSILNITGLKISNCNIGFAVYQKKPEYGPAKLTAEVFKESGVKKRYLLEEGSELTIDKVGMHPNGKNIYNLLYGSDQSK